MFDQNSDQFAVSTELLCLMKWLAEHDQLALENLVAHAYQNGLKEQLHTLRQTKQLSPTQAQNGIIDFFALLESILTDTIANEQEKNLHHIKFRAAVNHLDTKAFNNNTIRTSIEHATGKLDTSPAGAKELLLQELIKNWNPDSTKVLN